MPPQVVESALRLLGWVDPDFGRFFSRCEALPYDRGCYLFADPLKTVPVIPGRTSCSGCLIDHPSYSLYTSCLISLLAI